MKISLIRTHSQKSLIFTNVKACLFRLDILYIIYFTLYIYYVYFYGMYNIIAEYINIELQNT